MRDTLEDFQTCLLGGAIGDALGHAIEFLDISAIRKTYGEQGVRDFITPEFTDDTQMTLFTMEGLIRAELKNLTNEVLMLQEIHHAYLRWYFTQGEPIDPGLKTGWLLQQKSLFEQRAPGMTSLEALGSGRQGSRQYQINQSKGCGGVMRVAPVGLRWHRDPEKAFALGADSAALTHGHATGYLAAGFWSALMALLVMGEPLEKALTQGIEILVKHPGHEECIRSLDQAQDMHASGMEVTPERLEKMGDKWPGVLAEEAIGMAVFCALSFADDFPKGVLAAVNHSGDSDCTGSLTGQVLGLINPLDHLPLNWRAKLKSADMVATLAKDLFEISQMPFEPSEELLARYR